MAIEFQRDFWKNTWSHKAGLEGKLKGAILAAGLGKRMDPLTVTHLPKPLFPLGGKVPLAEIWVRRFVESGITDVSMNLCVLSETIKRHFGDGAKFAANIDYVDEKTPTGTFGGICKQVLGKDFKQVIADEPFFGNREFAGSTVIAPSGDVVTNFGAELLEEMYDIHRSVGAAMTIVLVPIPKDRRKDFGTVVLNRATDCRGIICKSGRIMEFREKDPDSPSNLNNASIYMVEMELLREFDKYRTPADPTLSEPFYDFGKHVFPCLLGKLPYLKAPKDFILWGIQYDGKWFDVGQKRDYLSVNNSLLDGELNIPLPYEKLPWGYLGKDTDVNFSKLKIIQPVVIGNNCTIEHDVTLGPYAVIGDGWVIRKGTTIRNSVLWERYSYFTREGSEISVKRRKAFDAHIISENVTIEQCIVAGGTVEKNIKEKTFDVGADGKVESFSIDHVPEGERA